LVVRLKRRWALFVVCTDTDNKAERPEKRVTWKLADTRSKPGALYCQRNAVSVTNFDKKLLIMRTQVQAALRLVPRIISFVQAHEAKYLRILAPKKPNLKNNVQLNADGSMKVDGCLAVFTHMVGLARLCDAILIVVLETGSADGCHHARSRGQDCSDAWQVQTQGGVWQAQTRRRRGRRGR